MKGMIALLSCYLLAGCTTYSKFSDTGAGLLAWDNDVSAGLIVPGGTTKVTAPDGTTTFTATPPKACMQWALAIKDIDSETRATMSDAILKLAQKVPSTATPQELLSVTNAITVTSRALNVSTERTVFLMVGSFYLCQLQANGLPATEVSAAYTHLVTQAATLANPNGGDGQVGALEDGEEEPEEAEESEEGAQPGTP